MGLINEQQRKNAQQERPEAEVINVSETPIGTGQEFELSPDAVVNEPEPTQEPTVETQEFNAPVVPGVSDFSLTTGNAQPTPMVGGFVPNNPLQTINNSSTRNNIWQQVTKDVSLDAPDVLSAGKPTVYDSSVVTNDAQRLNSQGIAGLSSSFDKYNSQQIRAAQAEQELKRRAADRTQNVNIPRKSQPWGFDIGQMFNDVIFGNKESQQATNVGGRFNPLAGEYGKQGAGLGGAVKYILSTPLNATVGLAADVNQATVNTLQNFGVDKESAQRFSRTGFLGIAADKFFGRQAVDDFGKKFGLQQDFSRTENNSALGQALTGQQVGDVNDPEGNRKGVFYRANRPLRTQQEIDAARLGKNDVFNVGSIGQAISDDPMGATYEIVLNVLDPAGNKIGDLAALGIRKLTTKVPAVKPEFPPKQTFNTPKPGVRINNQKLLPSSPSLQPRLALPPGKVKGVPVEEQLQQLYGQNIPPLRTTQQLPPAAKLPELPGTPPYTKVTLGDGRPVTATRVVPKELDNGTQTLVTPASDDLWKTPVNTTEPIRMGAVLESQIDSGLPKLPGDTKLADPWTADYLDYDLSPIKVPFAAFTPTKAPRIYEGTTNVIQRALPPAIEANTIDAVEEIIGTPSEAALRVGIGTPSTEAIVFADEIKVTGVDNISDDISEEVAEVIPKKTPVTETPVTETPVTETPVTETPVTETPVQTWSTGKTQPLPNIRWKKHPLASGAVKYVNPQELDKLWRQDRVDAGGIGGIGNRYSEAGEFITRNSNGGEQIIMSEVTIRNDGSIVFTDGRHRFAYLRDSGFTEIPMVVRNSKKLPENVRTRKLAATQKPTVEALEQAAEQLATHKQVIQAPLQQLEDMFDTVVDFGRKITDELPKQKLTPDDVLDAMENSAKVALHPLAKKSLALEFGDEIIEAFDSGDYFGLVNLLDETGEDAISFAVRVSEEQTKALATKVPITDVPVAAVPNVAKVFVNTTKATARDKDGLLRYTIKMPKVSHGSALANWTPNYSLRTGGSRGELGSGLYVTNKKSVATDYARAVISENASPETNAFDIAPAVYDLSHTLENTLSARAKLAPFDPLVKALVDSLPPTLADNVRVSLNRDKGTSFVGLMNKIEASLVRSSMTPDESTLKSINDGISDVLRDLGYDSVYDSKSGFGLVLDESKVAIAKSTPVSKAESATQAALARYNADAYAAKFYNERLTTDANLRDSAYKLLSHLESNVDDKLQQIQQEIIDRGLDKQATVLPPKQQFTNAQSINNSKPQTAKELMDTFDNKSTNPCEL